MELIHTLLFMLRENYLDTDLKKAYACLKSLEKSTYLKVIIYNQGFWDNAQVEEYLEQFNIDYIVIGSCENVGIVLGRKLCFDYIFENYPEIKYISELHMDMIFTHNWENSLVEYLKVHDEPVISSGIIDKSGYMIFLDEKKEVLTNEIDTDKYLSSLKQDKIIHGFTHPCIHNAKILQIVGGYNTKFLKGKQAFEDDSLLLAYFYYYGTKNAWYPKVNFNSVVYHEIAGQRLDIKDSILINYNGLVKLYGANGLKNLAKIHKSKWHINFFNEKYLELENNND